MKFSFLTILAAYIAMVANGEITPDNMMEHFHDTETLLAKAHEYKDGTLTEGEEFEFFKHLAEMSDDKHRMLRSEERKLASDSDELEAYSMIDSGFDTDYSVKSVNFGLGYDRMKVERKGHKCFIVGEESNDGADWASNFRFLKAPIDQTYVPPTYGTYRYQHCYWNWEKWGSRWWQRGWVRRCEWRTRQYVTNPGKPAIEGHKGFINAYEDMRDELMKHMNNICGSASHLVYTGWSRGGALATVAAAHHMRNNVFGNRHVSLITFGTPKSLDNGCPELARRLNVNKFQADFWDPVPILPPGYEHVGYSVSEWQWGLALAKAVVDFGASHRNYPL